MLNDLFNNIRIKIRERLNPYLGNYRRNKGGNFSFYYNI